MAVFHGSSRSSVRPAAKPARTSRVRRVLVMDDDEIVSAVMGGILAALGYRTLLTENGDSAIESFKKAKACGEPFDVVILDLYVPRGMNGKETIKKLLEIDPEVKAIVTSGNIDDPWLTNFREFGFREALPKPFTPAEVEKILVALAPLNE